MCGIAGVVRADRRQEVGEDALRRMAAALRHRGPDGWGLARGGGAGLVSTRLAIVDLTHGWQPLQTADSVLVYNGEVYNAPELRAELAREGVRCTTRSDTEVVLRLLERDGTAVLDRLNGQFALAWWQPRARRLVLVRDRFGVRPLHHATTEDGSLVFGSQARALFASGEVAPAPDLLGVDDVFSTWGARAPRSAFSGVSRLPAGGLLVWQSGEVVEERTWWRPEPLAPAQGAAPDVADVGELLRDSVRLRLRADVPVGTYLSGGLDSSLLTALAQQASDHPLRTFSVAFDDPRYDESEHQLAVARALGTQHHVVRTTDAALAGAFREAVDHAESPLVRTAPAPMALLAAAAREHGITVVATGEGADELFWGYDVFQEVLLRRAAAEDPAAETALDRLHPHLQARGGAAWRHAFTQAGPASDPLYALLPRLRATSAVRGLYRSEVAVELDRQSSADRLRAALPAAFGDWDDLPRTQWLEVQTLLEPYLLSAQGDRVAMAHGVEARYPFLDHRLHAMAARLPDRLKLDGPRDKVVLRELAADLLPAGTAARRKQPYRAPEVTPFFGPETRDEVEELLTPPALLDSGLFDPDRVQSLLRRCRSGRATGPRESMAFVAVLSSQLWWQRWLAGPLAFPEETTPPRTHLDLDDFGRAEQPAMEGVA